MASAILSSSPLTPPPASQSQSQSISNNSLKQSRKVQSLPFELAQHVQTYFEESLFTQGFNFLFSIVSSTASGPTSQSITIPSPEYLAVAATIAIHPSFTTRTNAQDKHEQANAALKLLRLINEVVGAEKAKLASAFMFRRYETRSLIRNEDSHEYDQQSNLPLKLHITYADNESVFASAEDFWAVVGWALNCSCLSGMYEQRWEWWNVWLQHMLDILHQDWHSRKNTAVDTCHGSLLWRYIESSSRVGAQGRRIFRAIFADGSVQSLNEFGEAFRKELRGPKSDENRIQKRKVNVNVDEEIFGDYLEQEESDYSSDDSDINGRKHTTAHEELLIASNSLLPRPSKRLRTRTPTGMSGQKQDNEPLLSENETNKLGSSESIRTRLRFLTLLLEVSSHPTLLQNPRHKYLFPDLHDLYTLSVEFIKPLPIPAFQQFILPSIHIHVNSSTQSTKLFSLNTLTILQEFMIRRLIESSAPSASIDHIIDIQPRPLTQELLVTHYLPFAAAAGSVGDHASKVRGATGLIDAQVRLTIVLEGMLRVLAMQGRLSISNDDSLMEALETGIQRRMKKAREGREGDNRGRRKEKEENGGVVEGLDEIEIVEKTLIESSERMRDVLKRLR